jgi:glycerol transport system ATP-binding protein
MSRIVLDQVAHSYVPNPQTESDWALREMEHVWEDGGAYALLGPSGCGKTTLLNVISGLLQPSQGRIMFDDQDVTALPPQQRNIAQVFQFPVIYDTMTVAENLAFPLNNRKFDKTYVKRRVEEVAQMLDLEGDLHKKGARLSADAKQKISLGRGLVRADVAAILFDEPLTVIDPQMKWQLRRKLKQIHEQTESTLVYVTHDQNEALTFADKVVVMYEGQVVQVGTPQELFERPSHTFVGYFIGSPGMNLLDCQLEGKEAIVNGGRVPLDEATAQRAHNATGRLQLGIRPEFLSFDARGQSGLPVRVEQVDDLGNFQILTVRLGGELLKVKIPEDAEPPGEDGTLQFPPDWTRLYADGQLVG